MREAAALAQCSCGSFGMSLKQPYLCAPDAAGLSAGNLAEPAKYTRWLKLYPNSSQHADSIVDQAESNPEWQGLAEPYTGGRPWFVPAGGVPVPMVPMPTPVPAPTPVSAHKARATH